MSATIRLSALISTMASTLGVECPGPLIAAREAGTHEDEALPAGRNDGRRQVRDPDVGDRPHVRDRCVSTAVGPRRPPPDGDRHVRNVVGQHLRHGVPVAGREVRLQALVHLACRVFQPRRLAGCSSSKRAIAASRSASSKISQRLTMSPSTVKMSTPRHSASKPSCEVPCRRMGDDRSEVAQPMHSLDVSSMSGVRSHPARRYAISSPGANAVPRRWSMFTQSGVVGGSSCRLSAA